MTDKSLAEFLKEANDASMEKLTEDLAEAVTKVTGIPVTADQAGEIVKIFEAPGEWIIQGVNSGD